MTAVPSLQPTDLTMLDGEPRVLDLRLAEALEFERPRDIRQLIERNLAELNRYGVCGAIPQTSGSQGGRPGAEFWLNEDQAILICMRSDAPRAADVRAEIIAVFKAWRHGRLAPNAPLTADLIGQMFDKKLVPVREDIGRIDAKVDRIDQNVIFLSRRVDDIVPRRDFAVWIIDQWREVVRQRYSGECPCCREKNEEWTADHFVGRERNGVEDGWPVCRKCNSKLFHDAQYKINKRKHFEVFQDNRHTMFGKGKGKPRDCPLFPSLPIQRRP